MTEKIEVFLEDLLFYLGILTELTELKQVIEMEISKKFRN